MTGDTNLPGNDAIFANLTGAGYPGLGSDNGILADLNIVSNLNQVVEFYT